MKNDAEKARARSRPRKKAAPPSPAAPTSPAPVQSGFKNVGSLESGFSLLLGVLFVAAALFPRSIKQIFLLGAGTSLVYRGMTSHCAVYEALGLDTDKGSLVGQVSEKVQAAKQG